MSAVVWLSFVGGLVVRIGVLVAALLVVRKGDARSGYVLAAAAGIDLLFLCCHRGLSQAMSAEQFEFDRQPFMYGVACVDALQPVLVTALIGVAVFLLAKAVKPSAQ